MTSPTSSMLAATQHCSLLDDVFQEDSTTLSLESYLADLTGKEASLFVMSGTMGNQLSVRTHLGDRRIVWLLMRGVMFWSGESAH